MSEGLVGRTLLNGEYEPRQILGRGGMATVYRAYSRSLDTDVAVKVLAPRLAADAGFRERFRDEARSLAGLHHPNLIEVHHYGEEDGLVYIVMRLAPGGTLKDQLRAIDGPLDLITTARLVGQVADALQHAHEHGLVHLDIKPANVLLGRADWPLLADFGITRAVSRQATTRGGERLAGTPLYMSPEQCVGGPVDGRSDQYSLAITAYELLTGQWPFLAETTEAILQRQIQDPPPRPREINPGIPGPVEQVLLRALAKDPNDRFPTIREFGEALVSAAERARGVTLETKAALAAITPNLLAIMALVLLGPFLLNLLPRTVTLLGAIPLQWPFQLLFSLLLAALLLGMRWHLIGLVGRGLGSMLDALDRVSGTSPPPGAGSSVSPRVKSWRNAAVGSTEGAINLGYLFAIYHLVAVSVLALLSLVADSSVQQVVTAALTILVVLAALGIIVGILRTGGPVVAALALALCWAAASVLPADDVGLVADLSLVVTLRATVSVGLLGVLLATRRSVHGTVRRLATVFLGRLIVEMRPAVPAERVESGRRRLGDLAAALTDFVYLLIGYALLRMPLIDGIQPFVGRLPSAVLVTGLAGIVWLLLIARLRWLASTLGLALGFLLGAPLLVSLPILEPLILGMDWPVTVAGWVVGTALILLLVAARGQMRDLGQRTLGPTLDRGMVGVVAAPTEEQSSRRVGALGAVAGAIIDVGVLLAGYWALGAPVVEALGKASGRAEFGSLLLVGLLLATIGVLFGPARRAASVLAETGGAGWASRARAFPGLVVSLAALMVSSFAATPATLAAPSLAGGLMLELPRVDVLVVNWEYWLPRAPGPEYGTYNLALSCSGGRSLGQFREALRVAPDAAMPAGSGGRQGSTNIPCDDWIPFYFGLRQSAGLPDAATFSWDWIAVEMQINPDETVDVVETHRVLFTSGSHQHLRMSLPVGTRIDSPESPGQSSNAPDSTSITRLEVWDGTGRLPLDSDETQLARHARTWEEDGRQWIGWWFSEVQSPTDQIYTVRYRLSGAVHRIGAGSRLVWSVLQATHSEPVWRTTVKVVLPGAFDPGRVNLSSTGVPTRNELIDGRYAWFDSRDAAPNTDLAVQIDFPWSGGSGESGAGPTATVTPTGTAELDGTRTPVGTSEAGAGASPTSATATSTPQVTATSTSAATPSATVASTPNATRMPTPLPSPTVTATATVTATPAATAQPSPTVTPTPRSSISSGACQAPVLAMYYAWYDRNTWTSGKTADLPTQLYESSDRATIERHVTQAKSVGIEGFELTWWGPENPTDTNLRTLLDVAQRQGFKATANFDLNSPFAQSAGDVTSALNYLKRYFDHPAWFRYNGKPVVVFYGIRKYDLNTWAAIRKQVDPNHEAIWIGEGDIFTYLEVFDGIHPYSVAWSSDPSRQLASYASRTRAYQGKIWMATVMPGYDDTKLDGPDRFAVDPQDGAYYTRLWQGAIATNPEIVSISSWNEWTEGHYIEPSQKYGDLFLGLTPEQVQAYKKSRCG